MDPNRTTDRILDEWDAVASTARPPHGAPRRRGSLAGLASGLGLAGAGILAAALVVGVIWLGGRISPGVGSPGPTPPAASQVAVATSQAPASPVAASPSPRPASHEPTKPPASPTPPPESACAPTELTAKITSWEGAAGSRIADVTVKNSGSVACFLSQPAAVDLIDGTGRVLINGAGPGGSRVSLAPGGTATTLVEASNYCGTAPTAPVRVRFDLGAGHHLTADAPTPSDATVPPCNGSTVPAAIQMHPWSR
jgi:uncharacterized protein DUF4232